MVLIRRCLEWETGDEPETGVFDPEPDLVAVVDSVASSIALTLVMLPRPAPLPCWFIEGIDRRRRIFEPFLDQLLPVSYTRRAIGCSWLHRVLYHRKPIVHV
eukprot:scpid71526/ scgid9261/ 